MAKKNRVLRLRWIGSKLALGLLTLGALIGCGRQAVFDRFPEVGAPAEKPAKQPASEYLYFGDYRIETGESLEPQAATGYWAYGSRPWVKGVVPVEFSTGITKAQQRQFWQACREWSLAAKVQCRPRLQGELNFVMVTDEVPDHCWTDVGAGSNYGKRTFNFSLAWCWNQPALIHEVGHVLGLIHEHQRPDRDRYLELHLENAGEYAFAYEKLSVGALDSVGPYDFMSIMHYWNGSYSTNGKAIMIPRKGYEAYANTMGTSKTLTVGDKKLIQKIYGAR